MDTAAIFLQRQGQNRFTRNTKWSGSLSVNLLNNYDGFTYDSPVVCRGDAPTCADT